MAEERRLLLLCFLLPLVSLTSATTHELTGVFGVLFSEGYPNPYPNFIDDEWVITVKQGFRVVLYFTDFDLEDTFDIVRCPHDYVEVTDGASTNDSIRFCGNPRIFKDDAPILLTQKLRSKGNQMIVRMGSDYSNDLPGNTDPLIGFKAHYYREDRNECVELQKAAEASGTPENVAVCDHFCSNYPGGYYCSCRKGYTLHANGYNCIGDCQDQIVVDTSGVISTPGYPGNYPPLTDCNWIIITEAGKTLELQFQQNFKIEAHFSGVCPYDYIELFDSNGKLGKFCGSTVPFGGELKQSSTNWVKINFHSDSMTQYVGFQITYKVKAIVCQLSNLPSHCTLSYINSRGESIDHSSNVVPFSSLIRFKCDLGFRLIGSGKIACLKDGSFSDDPPICEPF